MSFAYDIAGRRTSLTLPNGIVVEYVYDNASRVTEIRYKQGVTVIGNLTYEYDKNGSRTKIRGSFARTGIPQTISSTGYNAANQQTTFGDKTLTYDNNGNLTSIVDGSGTTLYTWNARNQLTAISGPGVNASFVYDGLGRRENKTINGSLTEFLYDGVNPVQETSGATVLANILGGLGIDEFFSRSDVPADSTSHFLPDGLRSAVALTDPAGAVQTEYTYEPFGRTTVTGVSNTNPFQYTGRENDGTALYYYRARFYHPQLERFISQDPLLCGENSPAIFLTAGFEPQGIHQYLYSLNSPILRTDPLGLTSHCSYYERRCKQQANFYYCTAARIVCNNFPGGDCVRECLQRFDERCVQQYGRKDVPAECYFYSAHEFCLNPIFIATCFFR